MDPFCGTGVVLQEALLMGCLAMGSDLEPRMIEYTQANIQWLHDTIGYDGTLLNLDVGDATSFRWISPFDTVACETYLGRPFSALPPPDILKEVMQQVDTIHRKFLQNIAKHPNVTNAREHGHDFYLCIAVPAWKTKHGFQHLKVLDNLEELGYTRMSFVHASAEELIYHREGQVVARELVVLTRK
jgi:tRNA G10  N-methylase Trm11